jgi:hypothetical protein
MVFKGLLPCACWTAANPNLRTSLLYYLPRRSFSDRMTRFSDPVVVEHDFSAYYSLAHGSWLWVLESLTNLPLNSGAQVLLAYHEWPLHVGVTVIRYVDSPP